MGQYTWEEILTISRFLNLFGVTIKVLGEALIHPNGGNIKALFKKDRQYVKTEETYFWSETIKEYIPSRDIYHLNSEKEIVPEEEIDIGRLSTLHVIVRKGLTREKYEYNYSKYPTVVSRDKTTYGRRHNLKLGYNEDKEITFVSEENKDPKEEQFVIYGSDLWGIVGTTQGLKCNHREGNSFLSEEYLQEEIGTLFIEDLKKELINNYKYSASEAEITAMFILTQIENVNKDKEKNNYIEDIRKGRQLKRIPKYNE